MPIINIQTTSAGLADVEPSTSYINTSDSVEVVVADGYLNQAVQSQLVSFSLPCMALVSTVSAPGVTPVAAWYNVVYSAGNWNLVAAASRGGTASEKDASNNALPTVASTAGSGFTAGHALTAADAAGTIQDSGMVLGQAAAKSVSDNSKSVLVSVGGEGAVVVGNLAEFADVNGTVNDSGIFTGDFGNAYTKNASDVSFNDLASVASPVPIVTGNLASFYDASGTIQDSGIDPSTLSTGTAGSKAASDNGLPILASVGGVAVGNLVIFGDVAGTVSSSGFSMLSIGKNVSAGGGSPVQNFVDGTCEAGDCIVGNWSAQSNPASVLTILAGAGSFDVTSTADAGAGTFNYMIMK